MLRDILVTLVAGAVFTAPMATAQVPQTTPHEAGIKSPPKIDAPLLQLTEQARKYNTRLVQMARQDGRVPVLIVLAYQPHEDALRRSAQQFAQALDAAQSRQRLAIPHAAPDPSEVAQATAAMEDLHFKIRLTALSQVEALIRPTQDRVEALLSTVGATHIRRFSGINMLRADVPASSIPIVAADTEVVEIGGISPVHTSLAQSVPAIHASAFWDAGYSGQGGSIAILDTGISDHPAFAGLNVVSRVFLDSMNEDPDTCIDASDQDGSTLDRVGHGTHVSGIVAGRGSSFWSDYKGVAKDLSTLYMLKLAVLTCDGGGRSNSDDYLSALEWLVHNTGASIINNSNGHFRFDPNKDPVAIDDDIFARAIDFYVRQYGLVMTVAAGNQPNTPFSSSYSGNRPCPVEVPAIAYNVIAVANWNLTSGQIDSSSCQGPTTIRENGDQAGRYKPDLAAPGNHSNNFFFYPFIGDGIMSANINWSGINPDYINYRGTSMAAPHVAGAAALLQSWGVTDPLAIKALLINSTDQIGWQPDIGWGFINLQRTRAWLNYFIGTAGTHVFYAGAPALGDSFAASLVWNRRSFPQLRSNDYNTSFTDLDLYAYDREGDFGLAESTTSQQNVEQVYMDSINGSGVVLKVNRYSGLSDTFALAVSSNSFARVNEPTLTASCGGPRTSVVPNGRFPVTCSLNDPGDLDLFDVQGSIVYTYPVSLDYTDQPSRSRLFAGTDHLDYTFWMDAPSVPGTYAVLPVFRGSAYDENYIWWAFNLVNVGSSSGLTIQSLTVDNNNVTPSHDAQLTVTLSGPAPSGGISVGNIINRGSMTLPFAVTIPEGQRSAQFTVSADYNFVTNSFQARLTSTLFNNSAYVDLYIAAP